MEDLNKHQVVLLCLLLTFVTSIGTGVITFSLLSEAPPAVTQTINRVVEKTIERVVPAENQASVSQITVKETVVVKEEDLIIEAVEKNLPKIVRIKGVRSPEVTSTFYGLGVVVRKDGLIVAPAHLFQEGVLYSAEFQDGKIVPLISSTISADKQFVFWKLAPDIKDLIFSPVVFAGKDSLKLGQSVVVLGGEATNTMTLARISSFGKSLSTTTQETSFQTIEIDVIPKDLSEGEALFNLSGEYIALGMSRDKMHVFVTAETIRKNFEALEKASE